MTSENQLVNTLILDKSTTDDFDLWILNFAKLLGQEVSFERDVQAPMIIYRFFKLGHPVVKVESFKIGIFRTKIQVYELALEELKYPINRFSSNLIGKICDDFSIDYPSEIGGGAISKYFFRHSMSSSKADQRRYEDEYNAQMKRWEEAKEETIELPQIPDSDLNVDYASPTTHLSSDEDGESLVVDMELSHSYEKRDDRPKRNMGTTASLKKLVEDREDSLRESRTVPTFTHACHAIPVSPKTVKKHAPELADKWYLSEYRPKPEDFD